MWVYIHPTNNNCETYTYLILLQCHKYGCKRSKYNILPISKIILVEVFIIIHNSDRFSYYTCIQRSSLHSGIICLSINKATLLTAFIFQVTPNTELHISGPKNIIFWIVMESCALIILVCNFLDFGQILYLRIFSQQNL